MPIRNAETGEYTTEKFAKNHPAKTVKESTITTRNFAKLVAKKRKTAAESLTMQMVYTLHSHPAFSGMSSQEILTHMNDLVKIFAEQNQAAPLRGATNVS